MAEEEEEEERGEAEVLIKGSDRLRHSRRLTAEKIILSALSEVRGNGGSVKGLESSRVSCKIEDAISKVKSDVVPMFSSKSLLLQPHTGVRGDDGVGGVVGTQSGSQKLR